jgi:hypothetical protein
VRSPAWGGGKFITLLGGTAAAPSFLGPVAARAQQAERMRRIDVLMAYAESDTEVQALVAAFREGLQKLGWTESRNIRIDTRWATADVELMQRFAREIVELRPDLILTQNTPTTASIRPLSASLLSTPPRAGPVMLGTKLLTSFETDAPRRGEV